MTNRGVLLYLLMKELGADARLETFRDRLLLQKGVYLLQALGIPTDFSYNWYIRGPYSPGLTQAAFEEVVKPINQADKTCESYSLTDDAQKKVEEFKSIACEYDEADLTKEKWLELLASMHFYRHKMYFPPSERSERARAQWLYEKLPAENHSGLQNAIVVSRASVMSHFMIYLPKTTC